MKAKCIAHRGCHKKYYENTIEAFKEAVDGNYFGIETDIHLTKDKKWIIHHDEDFLSNGKKYIIKEMNSNELIKMPLDNDSNHKDAYMPMLKDYLELLKGSSKRPIIEIKPKNPSFHQLRRLVKLVKEYFTLDEVDFIAFYPWPLLKLKFMYHKKVHIQQLVEEYQILVKTARFHKFGLDMKDNRYTQEIIDKYHKKKLKTNAWTVDDLDMLHKLEAMGIDYITTNEFDQNT